MNHIYRLIWNRTLGAFVVASEFARPQGRACIGVDGRSPMAPLSALCLAMAMALGSGQALASDDRRLDDLVALVGKYVDASGAPVRASAPGIQSTSPGTATLHAPRQDALTVAAASAPSPLMSLEPGAAAGPAMRTAAGGIGAAVQRTRVAAGEVKQQVAAQVRSLAGAGTAGSLGERASGLLPDTLPSVGASVHVLQPGPARGALLGVDIDLGAADRQPAPQDRPGPALLAVSLDMSRDRAGTPAPALALDANVGVASGRGRGGLVDADLDAGLIHGLALDADLAVGAAPGRGLAVVTGLDAGLGTRLTSIALDADFDLELAVERAVAELDLELDTGVVLSPERGAEIDAALAAGAALNRGAGRGLQDVLGEVIGGLAGQGHAGGIAAPVTGVVRDVVGGVAGALDGAAAPDALAGTLEGVVGGLASGVDGVGGGLAGGTPQAALGTLTGVVSGVTGALAGPAGPGTGGQGNGVREALTGTLGAVGGVVEDTVGGLLGQTGLGAAIGGVTGAVTGTVGQTGSGVAHLVGGLTGSDALAGTVDGVTGGLASGLDDIVSNVVDTDLEGIVGSTAGTVTDVVGHLVGGATGTVSGLVGAAPGLGGIGQVVGGVVGGVGGGLTGAVGGLLGSTPQAAPPVPVQAGSPGLVIGTGGLTGSLGELLDSTTTGLFGGDGYIRNGNLAVNSANVQQGYSVVSVLGLPAVNLTPVGTLLDAVGGAATGGNSYLTLIGGVTSDSYITGINNGDPGGLLGLVLPDQAPAWAARCASVLGAVNVDCWAVNAAQNYQVLIGDGAYANGSKEVVIGTNARHQLPVQSAAQAFPGDGLNDPDNPTGVPSADYAARLGHSVVIGDSASGSANAQVLLGAGATSNRANSVALGFQSNASRGAQGTYTAFGLAAPQRSVGEVAVGSAGNERQITHVAAGSAATDAVNVAQLQGAISLANGVDLFSVKYDMGPGGVPDYRRISLGNGAGTTLLTNLTDGSLAAGSRDAVNGGQLRAGYVGMSAFFGGGASFDGTWTAPTFRISNIALDGAESLGDYSSVAAAFEALNTSLVNVNLRIPDAGVDGGTGGEPYLDVNSTGTAAVASGVEAVALGPRSLAVGEASVAVGSSAEASADNSVALGAGSVAATGAETGYTGAYAASGSSNSAGEVSVGSSGSERKVTHVADGSATYDAVNVGQLESGVEYAIEQSREYTDTRINNLGGGTAGMFQVNDTGALGAPRASGQASAAGGAGAVASGNASTAVGNGAQAQAANSVALGAGSVADRANTVSVGNAGSQRQVTHVAAGTADTDAVNVAQMNRGMADTLGWANAYTDDRFSAVGRDMRRIDDRASAGVASAMAVAGLPQPYEAGRSMASVAAGSFNGESGMAVGISGVTEGGRWIYKFSGSTNTRGDGGVSIGAGIQW